MAFEESQPSILLPVRGPLNDNLHIQVLSHIFEEDAPKGGVESKEPRGK